LFLVVSAATRRAQAKERHNESMALICCLYMFFVAYLTFTNYETYVFFCLKRWDFHRLFECYLFRIASPLSIDMYAWSKEQSTRDNGYLLGGLGLMSVVVLIVTKILAKRYD
jgi:hypothetical protein